MAHTYLLFDFGTDEDAAQQARHKAEGWKQAFRLDKKLLVKFDRGDAEPVGEEEAAAKAANSKSKKDAAEKQPVKLVVRLDFSDHEKLSHQRWMDRIPTEALFRDANPKIIRQSDPEFTATAERFDALT